MIKEVLEQNADLQQFLFIRGFLATNRNDLDMNGFPFYGNWEMIKLQDMFFYKHNQTGFHFYQEGDKACFLFGHAYNPFTMEIDENKILERMLPFIGTNEFYRYVDELTGIFVLGVMEDGKVSFLVDPSGMQSACYCLDGKDFYISSHPQLVADICGYEMDSFVKKLITYKWYARVMGPYLPADMTPYTQAKRIVPNIAYSYDIADNAIMHERFYPLKELSECKTDEEYNAVIQEAADILKNNMSLVVQKWNNPWQSLTGGIDSNTTFAAANGHYDKIKTFSYCSAEKETIDCDAAKIISEKFNVDWILFNIPNENAQIERFVEKSAIIRHNNAYIGLEKDNELRKRMILQEQCHADVEIKSWTSETIRAYWYKHYGRKKMPKLSAKLYRNLYKIFIANRKLAHQIDKIFAEYIEKFEYEKIPSQYPAADMHYNEVTWGSWGGMNISEMKYCFDITIIYNNRRFLDLLFRVPLEKRISDQHHLDMKKYLNKELFDMNIRVVNMKETKFRAFALNVIFTINSWLPF
jgi:hypothetical protein